MGDKIKLVIIMYSELVPRYLDFFCLDILSENFDLEYWDCSDFVLPGFHFSDKVERPYSYKIHNLNELNANLARLPKDSLICNDVHWNNENKTFFKILGKYFQKIVYINFYANTLAQYESNRYERLVNRIKNQYLSLKGHIYNQRLISLFCFMVLHPKLEIWKEQWASYQDSVRRLKKTFVFYEISCALGSKYKINHPDVEKYVDTMLQQKKNNENRYIVYLDQYYPYHGDCKEFCPAINVPEIAKRFHYAINRYFDKIESIYGCKVVIAAHPLSDYSPEAFDNRTIVKGRTAELVKDSIGVLLHFTNALSYVMLFNKPAVLLSGESIKAVAFFHNAINRVSKQWRIPIRNIDNLDDLQNFAIPSLLTKRRDVYIKNNFGIIDNSNITKNSVLLTDYLYRIWEEMYK